MSVPFDHLTLTVPPIERRTKPRFRFDVLMPGLLGRGDALILDISEGGARVMHFAGYALDSQVRLSFAYGGRRFAATARVLASRVVGLGNGPAGTTSFESRLRFDDDNGKAAATLARIVEQIETARLRVWVSNAAGEGEPSREEERGQYFLRCRFLGMRWTKCWTRDDSQPDHGFTVPAKLSDGEVDMLCEAFELADDGGRHLIRLTAGMAA